MMQPLPDKIRFLCVAGYVYAVEWEKMMVGSSVFLPTTATPGQVNRALNPIRNYFGIKLAAYSRTERGRHGIRVWRVA